MTLRDHLTAIDLLCDPLPKTASDAFDRLCLISEEIEAALDILGAAQRGSQSEAVEKWNLTRRHVVLEDPEGAP